MALVVTIVVLIILATVSINAVMGENGIIRKAEIARDMHANSLESEQDAMDILLEEYANAIAGNSGVSSPEPLEISYTIEDIDASGKAVKISVIGVEVTIADMELMLAETYGFTTLSDLLTAMGHMTEEEFYTMVEGQTSLPYEEGGLKAFVEFIGVDTSGVTVEPTIGNTRLSYAKSEFIATRNGTYTVKATAEDGRQVEIQVNVTGIVEEKFSRIYETTTTYTDENGKIAKIPAGFAVGTSDGINTIEEGLVITDAVDENGYSIGNEFVWIPVESDSTFIRESFGDSTLSSYNTEPFNYTDGTTTYTGYSTEEAEYNTMRTQVLAHHGFYISRYEAGDRSIQNGMRTATTGVNTVVSKRGVAPYNWVKWGESMSEIGTEGAVYLAQNMYAGKTQANSVTSTLCYGVQWDAMCRYIEDYDRTTPTKSSPDLTGRVGGDNSKNIYDLAGNCFEWTMEANRSDCRVVRGGYYAYSFPASGRYGVHNPSLIDNNNGCFRAALYVK